MKFFCNVFGLTFLTLSVKNPLHWSQLIGFEPMRDKKISSQVCRSDTRELVLKKGWRQLTLANHLRNPLHTVRGGLQRGSRHAKEVPMFHYGVVLTSEGVALWEPLIALLLHHFWLGPTVTAHLLPLKRWGGGI